MLRATIDPIGRSLRLVKNFTLFGFGVYLIANDKMRPFSLSIDIKLYLGVFKVKF